MISNRYDVQKIVAQMTIDEKIACCALDENDRYAALPRFGVEGLKAADNSSGGWYDYFRIRSEEGWKNSNFWGTLFPPAAVLGSTWDEELCYEVGKAVGRECKYNHVDVVLRPGVNMKRSPLCGRNFEYFSEDPVLSGELGGSYIQGIQSEKTAACLKHYAVNNHELERLSTNVIVSERALREIYLRVFQIAIEKGQPWIVMTGYNRVNGDWVYANHHLMDILRNDFNYNGMVVSDYASVSSDRVEGHKCGLDAETYKGSVHNYLLADAFSRGEVTEKQLDEIVYRVLDCYFKIKDKTPAPETIDLELHHDLAKRSAVAGTVLLENTGILPLRKEMVGKLGIIGGLAKIPTTSGGGSGHMNGHTRDNAYDEIIRLLGCSDNTAFAQGYEMPDLPQKDIENAELLKEAVKIAEESDVIILFVGYYYGWESEGYDRPDMRLPHSQVKLIDAVTAVNSNVIIYLSTGAPVDLSRWSGKVQAIVQGGYGGEAAGAASAEVIFGIAEPGGRLAETYPLKIEDNPSYTNFPTFPNPMPDVVYGEDIYIGYRYYEHKDIKPLYPFGYGLGYTTFSYSDLVMDKTQMTEKDKVTIGLKVKNTGLRPGSDVVQVYVKDVLSMVSRPQKELKAFRKVFLQPGETKTVTVALDRKAFELFTPALSKWVVEAGEYQILIGRNSSDIILTGSIRMDSGEKVFRYHRRMSLAYFIDNPELNNVLKECGADQATINFFDFSKNPLLCLLVTFPWGRLEEADFGQGNMSRKMINDVINKLNSR